MIRIIYCPICGGRVFTGGVVSTEGDVVECSECHHKFINNTINRFLGTMMRKIKYKK